MVFKFEMNCAWNSVWKWKFYLFDKWWCRQFFHFLSKLYCYLDTVFQPLKHRFGQPLSLPHLHIQWNIPVKRVVNRRVLKLSINFGGLAATFINTNLWVRCWGILISSSKYGKIRNGGFVWFGKVRDGLL